VGVPSVGSQRARLGISSPTSRAQSPSPRKQLSPPPVLRGRARVAANSLASPSFPTNFAEHPSTNTAPRSMARCTSPPAPPRPTPSPAHSTPPAPPGRIPPAHPPAQSPPAAPPPSPPHIPRKPYRAEKSPAQRSAPAAPRPPANSPPPPPPAPRRQSARPTSPPTRRFHPAYASPLICRPPANPCRDKYYSGRPLTSPWLPKCRLRSSGAYHFSLSSMLRVP